jgi:arginyl-tRNA synthetase
MIQQKLKAFIGKVLKEKYFQAIDMPDFLVEQPAEKEHGDFSCNIALKSAKLFRRSPSDIAFEFVAAIESSLENDALCDFIERIEVKNPGFINFFLSPEAFYDVMYEVFAAGADFGRNDIGKDNKVLLEFVSANPTGPLSVAHARQAVVGDVLGNILKYVGCEVKKEFYVNDGGNQIVILGRSVVLRAKEIFGENIEFPEECYQGEYIKDMARIFIEEKGYKDISSLTCDPELEKKSQSFAAGYLMDVIKKELDDFGVNFDIYSYESEVATKAQIAEVLHELTDKGYTKEEDGALWFMSSRFGDDKDRVVRKSDGNYTYLAPDIAYHKNKFDRGFNTLINIWGPDHHGYIPRIKAAVQALGRNSDAIKVLIIQLATIYRNGQQVSMSTRKGQYIGLREVMEEVGKDVARFFYLMRHTSMHLEFDLDLAKKESSENPVYYIQYAHARINSIYKRASETGLEAKKSDFYLLKEPAEIDLLKKMGDFPAILVVCYQQLDPYALVNYLQELATSFHRFYDTCRVIDQDRDLSSERFGLIRAAQTVFRTGLGLLGVSVPDKM